MSKSMFEVYLNEVTDEGLRARLKAEFERTTKKFGLVFERHSPEGIRMPHVQVRRGRTVIREADGTFHKVRAIGGDSVTLADEHGNVIEENLSNVTAARQFGEVVFPGLKTVGSVRTGNPEDPAHVVINGENFHALEMLGYTHPESVDLIYIDPPFPSKFSCCQLGCCDAAGRDRTQMATTEGSANPSRADFCTAA